MEEPEPQRAGAGLGTRLPALLRNPPVSGSVGRPGAAPPPDATWSRSCKGKLKNLSGHARVGEKEPVFQKKGATWLVRERKVGRGPGPAGDGTQAGGAFGASQPSNPGRQGERIPRQIKAFDMKLYGPKGVDDSQQTLLGQWMENHHHEKLAYSSLAMWAEVTLQRVVADTAHLHRPNPLRTAVCCMLLDSVTSLFGRYEGLMHRLKDELFASIYHEWPCSKELQDTENFPSLLPLPAAPVPRDLHRKDSLNSFDGERRQRHADPLARSTVASPASPALHTLLGERPGFGDLSSGLPKIDRSELEGRALADTTSGCDGCADDPASSVPSDGGGSAERASGCGGSGGRCSSGWSSASTVTRKLRKKAKKRRNEAPKGVSKAPKNPQLALYDLNQKSTYYQVCRQLVFSQDNALTVDQSKGISITDVLNAAIRRWQLGIVKIYFANWRMINKSEHDKKQKALAIAERLFAKKQNHMYKTCFKSWRALVQTKRSRTRDDSKDGKASVVNVAMGRKLLRLEAGWKQLQEKADFYQSQYDRSRITLVRLSGILQKYKEEKLEQDEREAEALQPDPAEPPSDATPGDPQGAPVADASGGPAAGDRRASDVAEGEDPAGAPDAGSEAAVPEGCDAAPCDNPEGGVGAQAGAAVGSRPESRSGGGPPSRGKEAAQPKQVLDEIDKKITEALQKAKMEVEKKLEHLGTGKEFDNRPRAPPPPPPKEEKSAPFKEVMRWVNFKVHSLSRPSKKITNFVTDFSNCHNYAYLLRALGVFSTPKGNLVRYCLNPSNDDFAKAELVLSEAEKLLGQPLDPPMRPNDILKAKASKNAALIFRLHKEFSDSGPVERMGTADHTAAADPTASTPRHRQAEGDTSPTGSAGGNPHTSTQSDGGYDSGGEGNAGHDSNSEDGDLASTADYARWMLEYPEEVEGADEQQRSRQGSSCGDAEEGGGEAVGGDTSSAAPPQLAAQRCVTLGDVLGAQQGDESAESHSAPPPAPPRQPRKRGGGGAVPSAGGSREPNHPLLVWVNSVLSAGGYSGAPVENFTTQWRDLSLCLEFLWRFHVASTRRSGGAAAAATAQRQMRQMPPAAASVVASPTSGAQGVLYSAAAGSSLKGEQRAGCAGAAQRGMGVGGVGILSDFFALPNGECSPEIRRLFGGHAQLAGDGKRRNHHHHHHHGDMPAAPLSPRGSPRASPRAADAAAGGFPSTKDGCDAPEGGEAVGLGGGGGVVVSLREVFRQRRELLASVLMALGLDPGAMPRLFSEATEFFLDFAESEEQQQQQQQAEAMQPCSPKGSGVRRADHSGAMASLATGRECGSPRARQVAKRPPFSFDGIVRNLKAERQETIMLLSCLHSVLSGPNGVGGVPGRGGVSAAKRQQQQQQRLNAVPPNSFYARDQACVAVGRDVIASITCRAHASSTQVETCVDLVGRNALPLQRVLLVHSNRDAYNTCLIWEDFEAFAESCGLPPDDGKFPVAGRHPLSEGVLGLLRIAVARSVRIGESVDSVLGDVIERQVLQGGHTPQLSSFLAGLDLPTNSAAVVAYASVLRPPFLCRAATAAHLAEPVMGYPGFLDFLASHDLLCCRTNPNSLGSKEAAVIFGSCQSHDEGVSFSAFLKTLACAAAIKIPAPFHSLEFQITRFLSGFAG